MALDLPSSYCRDGQSRSYYPAMVPLFALAPAPFVRNPVAIPRAAIFVLLLQRYLVERTVVPILLGGSLSRPLDAEPLAGLLDLRLDAGEVHPYTSS